MEDYKHYMLGHHFRVRSDHEAFKWLFSMKKPKHHMASWMEVLSEFYFELECCPSMKHGNTEAMSRCPNPRDCSCLIAEEHELPCKSWKKCLRKPELMLGILPDQVSQPFDITHRTGDSANVQSDWRHCK